LAEFLTRFPITTAHDTDSSAGAHPFVEWTGATFGNGIYRVHTVESAAAVLPSVELAHPQMAGRISLFGFDWLGRQYAGPAGGGTGANVLLFEPGTGDMLEAPATVADFHDVLLAEFGDDVLAEPYFLAWQDATGGAPLEFGQCVGYTKPLFLGGADELSNLEVSELEVYWSISAQLWSQIRDLPPGTPVGNITIS
jgi:hypothetical protein